MLICFNFSGTQQELRKASRDPNSSSRPASLKDALDQLQSIIKLSGADKRYVYGWVLDLIEMVSCSLLLIEVVKVGIMWRQTKGAGA